MKFPVAVKQVGEGQYEARVLDLQDAGIITGRSTDDVLNKTQQHLRELMEARLRQGDFIPSPKRIDDYRLQFNDSELIWSLVNVDIVKLLGKCKRINITFPELLMEKIDKYADKHGSSRSAVLAEAALSYISREH